ncbi:triose-phosphate isomerase [Helicobacter sp. 23-1045]
MKIIAGNFKSNKNRADSIGYLNALDSRLNSATKELLDSRKIYIFPAITSLVANDFANLTLGAQNAHFAEGGAFTGEISLCHLSEFHIKTILIGHSERRTLFGESDEVVAKKFAFFAKQNFEIFLCVGENLAIRQSNKTKDFLRSQLEKIDLDYPNLIIAYEPIWAIGTGQNASLEQISEVYEFLQNIAKKPILYGGSVNANNAKEIISATDGVLVGGASLEVEHFYQIIRS